jgi:hypothetical protein
MMKKITLLLSALFLISGCTTPYSHQSIAVNLKPRGTRVEIKEMGRPRILGLFASGREPDAYQTLTDLRELNGCRTLANIDMNYYEKHYFFWSRTLLKISADCVN